MCIDFHSIAQLFIAIVATGLALVMVYLFAAMLYQAGEGLMRRLFDEEAPAFEYWYSLPTLARRPQRRQGKPNNWEVQL